MLQRILHGKCQLCGSVLAKIPISQKLHSHVTYWSQLGLRDTSNTNMSPPGEWVQRTNRSDNTDTIFLSIYLQKGYNQAVKRVKKAKTKETDG